MRREELIEAIQKGPFRPFRLYVSDGRTFDIRHPEMLMVARNSASVGVLENGGADESNPGYPEIDRFALVDLLRITGVEQLSAPKHRGG